MICDYEVLKKLDKWSDDQLIQFHANAYSTMCMALGHGKSWRNEHAMKSYAEELHKRGITEIPKREGVFNGDGTS
tara:strand:+ start:264 stop:488 length:225 start_codon:yes stop_codon:yes gene_type:complete